MTLAGSLQQARQAEKDIEAQLSLAALEGTECASVFSPQSLALSVIVIGQIGSVSVIVEASS